jgi:5-formyltetrahydrofolate cyclo-ligase
MKSSKAALRKKMLAARAALTQEDVRTRSFAIQKHILADEAWLRASSVALYAAVKQEAQTWRLLEQAWRSGRQVYLPRVGPNAGGALTFARCASKGHLISGAFGIPEPDPLTCPACDFTLENAFPDLLIVPGVAFDRSGHRLGMGGGYYDRFLSAAKTLSIGLAYGFQLLEAIPAERWDKNVNAVCTEQGLLWMT